MSIFWRLIINALALLAAAYILPGIQLGAGDRMLTTNDWLTLVLVALIFGLVNAFVKPLLALLTLPFTILSLGLFVFILNALMLLLTSAIAGWLQLNFVVDGFVPALLGSLIISVVSVVLSWFLKDSRR